MEAVLKYFTTHDGTKLFYQWWLPDHPKAVLVVVHGMGDHSERYGPFIRYFVERGYAVALYDQRGHGRSEGLRGHVEQFQDLLQDLAIFIQKTKEAFPKAPFFLVGHSFGGQVALNFVVRYAKGLRGLILSSPNIQLTLPIPSWQKKLANWARKKTLRTMRLEHKINAKDLSHDQAVVDAYLKDPFVFSFVTCQTGALIMQNLDIMMALASRVHIPTMFMHAGSDVICSPEGTKAFYLRVPIPNKQLKIYDGMFHELFNEVGREQVFQDVETWLAVQLKEDAQLGRLGLKRTFSPQVMVEGKHG